MWRCLKMTTINRNIIELEEIPSGVTDPEEMRQILNRNITELNFVLRSLTLTNFDGEIITTQLPAASTVDIPHKLGIVPKYKILLKQVEGGLVRDVEFTENYVRLQHLGVTPTTITFIIVKD